MGRIRMDNKVLGGLILVCVLVVIIAGAIIYNFQPSNSDYKKIKI
jgi:CHASE3 domain sensor protein